jgi:thioredoxin 1
MKPVIRVVFTLVVLTFLGTSAFAGAKSVPYSPEVFGAAQAAGTTIVVDVYAEWCPTCRAQQPILEELKAEPALQDVLFVTVDFDAEKEFLRAHRIPSQSTILVFKGEKEVTRSIGETDRERLRTVVLSAAAG